ncbi:MAG TPA: DNA polymerase III subunit delta [Fibrobacteria bacterium]|nr:DNA polymerase III subunit delta [Fibrobacteria bacterium]
MTLTAFLGNDELRKQEALDAEVTAWAGQGGDCIRETFHGDELRWEEVAESYRTADLFAPRKAIVIRNWEKVRDSSLKALEEVFAEDNPQVAVFLCGEKWDGRSKLAKAAAAAKRIKEFRLPYDNEIPGWIVQRAQQRYGRRLGQAEARHLQDAVGNKLDELDHELEKLDTFLAKGRPITAEDIEELVSPLKAFGRFELQKLMGQRKKVDFLPALRSVLDDAPPPAAGKSDTKAMTGPPPPFMVVQWLFSHYLTLLKVRALLDEGVPESAIAEEVKVNGWIFKKDGYLDQARLRSQAQWKACLARLARIEREMKQGRYIHRFELELAFASLV